MIPLCLAAGIVAGLLYFAALWWNVRLFAQGGSGALTLLLMAARFALLGGLLYLAALAGALALLAMAAGVLIARLIVLRRVRSA